MSDKKWFQTTKNLVSVKIQGSECGRWDLNPHERNAHKILSLARLPVPTLPHIAFLWDSFVSPSRQVIV